MAIFNLISKGGLAATFLAVLASSQPAAGQCPMTNPPDTTTAQHDQKRSGANQNETCLSPTSVTSTNPSIKVTFGTIPAGGTKNSPVYAEPLYVHNLAIGPGGALRNVVIIATLDDYVYAYDADDYTPTQYYGISLINDLGDCGGTNNGIPIPTPGAGLPKAGIVSTPVIYIPSGSSTPTLTVVGGCQVSSIGAASDSWYLHTLNLLNGQDLNGPGTRVAISASVSSSDGGAGCAGTSCSMLNFNAQYALQRPALMQVLDGVTTEIYIGFGVNNASETRYQTNPYHGWLVGYNPGQTLPSFQFVTTPTGPTGNSNSTTPCTNNSGDYQGNPTNTCGLGAGIWQGGKGFVVYVNNGTRYIYAGSGNGGFQTGSTNWGSSVLGFSEALTGGPPSTSFTPRAYGRMNYYDQDMGTSGPLLTSANDLVIFDKTGEGYVLNPANLGGFTSGDSGAVGEFAGSSTAGGTCDGGANGGSTACDEITSQVFWSDSSGNSYLLVWPWNEGVDWCLWNGSNNFQCYANTQSPVAGFPGGTLVLSSNGANISTAILWAITLPSTAQAFLGDDSDLTSYNGVLHAFGLTTPPTSSAAGTLTELWNSSADTWAASKFAMPTVANGRIYVPTYNKGVIGYANY